MELTFLNKKNIEKMANFHQLWKANEYMLSDQELKALRNNFERLL